MKDRSKTVELPCEVGDSVWVALFWTTSYLGYDELIECRVESFKVTDDMKVYVVLRRLRPEGIDCVFTLSAEEFQKYTVFEKKDGRSLWRNLLKEKRSKEV